MQLHFQDHTHYEKQTGAHQSRMKNMKTKISKLLL